jgi:hypothetical protein
MVTVAAGMLSLVALGAAQCPPSTTTTPNAGPMGASGNWTQVENDQFAGASSLPPDVHPNLAWGGSSAKGYGMETDVPGQVSLQSDGVHLTGNPATGQSGAITTAAQSGGTKGFYLQPGKTNFVQMTAKIPGGNGWWPAFWLLAGGNGNWPWPPEIDIFEGGLGGAGSSQYLEGHFHQTNGSQSGYNLQSVDTGFHTYGFELSSSAATWFIDGKQVGQTTNTGNIADEWSHGGLYVVLNLAMGGTAGSPPSSSGAMVIQNLQGWTQ